MEMVSYRGIIANILEKYYYTIIVTLSSITFIIVGSPVISSLCSHNYVCVLESRDDRIFKNRALMIINICRTSINYSRNTISSPQYLPARSDCFTSLEELWRTPYGRSKTGYSYHTDIHHQAAESKTGFLCCSRHSNAIYAEWPPRPPRTPIVSFRRAIAQNKNCNPSQLEVVL